MAPRISLTLSQHGRRCTVHTRRVVKRPIKMQMAKPESYHKTTLSWNLRNQLVISQLSLRAVTRVQTVEFMTSGSLLSITSRWATTWSIWCRIFWPTRSTLTRGVCVSRSWMPRRMRSSSTTSTRSSYASYSYMTTCQTLWMMTLNQLSSRR